MMGDTEELKTFGGVVTYLLSTNEEEISLAKLSREADVDYAYLHSLMKGRRGTQELRPSMDMVIKIMEAMRRLEIRIPLWAELDLMETAVSLPEGFSIKRDSEDNEIQYETDPDLEFIVESYRGADTEQRKLAKDVLSRILQNDSKQSIGGVKATN